MTITIDTSSPYMWLTILFFAALFITNLLLQVKSIQLRRRLIMGKEHKPTDQLEAALGIIEALADNLEVAVGFAPSGSRGSVDELIRSARTLAARLKQDAGL